jgi:hypothetical protein
MGPTVDFGPAKRLKGDCVAAGRTSCANWGLHNARRTKGLHELEVGVLGFNVW